MCVDCNKEVLSFHSVLTGVYLQESGLFTFWQELERCAPLLRVLSNYRSDFSFFFSLFFSLRGLALHQEPKREKERGTK